MQNKKSAIQKRHKNNFIGRILTKWRPRAFFGPEQGIKNPGVPKCRAIM
ncbi:hypothetical protein [Flagellimonas baculiformis]|nr:hypothetical protein [Muricauda sp. D6]